MLCDVCNENEVVLTLTEIVGDGVRHIRLCEDCAAAKGVNAVLNSGTPDLSGMLQSVHSQLEDLQGDLTKCTFCGSSISDFRKSGRVGCAQCYVTFEKPLRDLLRRVHGNSRHVGSSYDGPSHEQMLSVGTREQLKQRLQRAISAEEFELAATLRDQLRALEK